MSEKLVLIITRYNEPNHFLIDCFEGLLQQNDKVFVVLLLDQKEDTHIEKMVKKYDFVQYKKIPAKSLSYARNLGIKEAKSDIIAFLDCDAIPSKNRVQEIKESFALDNSVAIVGTKILPKWLLPSKLIHRSSLILEQYSLLDLGDNRKYHKKVTGASFALHTSKVGGEAYFDESLGRQNGKLLGGEETDLCERVILQGHNVMYTGMAFVYHQIQKERISRGWALKRIYRGGYSRAVRGGKPSPHHKEKGIYDYILSPLIILFYGYGYLRGKLKN